MKILRWRRYTWDLSQLPQLETPLPKCYTLRSVDRTDDKTVANVIMTSFSLDAAWSDALHAFRDSLVTQIEACFTRESQPAIVIMHGQRIIAASAISTEVDAESHLVSGPCVLVEYRNRGLGTALLWQTLRKLREAGLTHASAITKDNVATAKFLYPKFGSTHAVCQFGGVLAGAAGA